MNDVETASEGEALERVKPTMVTKTPIKKMIFVIGEDVFKL